MPQSITVNVSEDGTVRIDAAGFKGAACEKATKAIEQALGTVKGKSRKPEYHATAAQQQKAGQ